MDAILYRVDAYSSMYRQRHSVPCALCIGHWALSAWQYSTRKFIKCINIIFSAHVTACHSMSLNSILKLDKVSITWSKLNFIAHRNDSAEMASPTANAPSKGNIKCTHKKMVIIAAAFFSIAQFWSDCSNAGHIDRLTKHNFTSPFIRFNTADKCSIK